MIKNSINIKILGIDPGSLKTGFALIDYNKSTKKITPLEHGVFLLASQSSDFNKRLYRLYCELERVLEQYKPDVLSIEKIFFAKNAVSALKLGQARGVALVLAEKYKCEIFEYNPTQVKSYILGKGRASKEEIAQYLELVLGKQSFKTHDASDALSLCICHAYAWSQAQRLKSQTRTLDVSSNH